MPEGNASGAAPQAGADPQPQAGTTPANPPAGAATPNSQSSQPANGEGETALSLEDAKKLRSEAATLRKRLKEFEDAKAAAEAASLTDIEKLQKQHETVSKQAEAYRGKIAQMAIQLEAQKLGIVDPEVAATLVAGKLEFDADGSPNNVEPLLRDLVKAKPYLVAQAQQGSQQPATPPVTAGGATNPSRSGTNGGAKIPLSWDYINQLATTNTHEYLARGPEIQRWMLDNLASRPRR